MPDDVASTNTADSPTDTVAEFVGTPTLSDHYVAHLFAAAPRSAFVSAFGIFLLAATLVVPVLLLFAGYFLPTVWIAVAALAALPLLLWVQWRLRPFARAHFSCRVTPDAIITTGEDMAMQAKWSAFARHRSYRSVVILFFAGGPWLALFKRHCSSDDRWEAFKRLVETKLPHL